MLAKARRNVTPPRSCARASGTRKSAGTTTNRAGRRASARRWRARRERDEKFCVRVKVNNRVRACAFSSAPADAAECPGALAHLCPPTSVAEVRPRDRSRSSPAARCVQCKEFESYGRAALSAEMNERGVRVVDWDCSTLAVGPWRSTRDRRPRSRVGHAARGAKSSHSPPTLKTFRQVGTILWGEGGVAPRSQRRSDAAHVRVHPARSRRTRR